MKVFQTDQLGELSSESSLWVYNGLDSCLTNEIWGVLKPKLEADPFASTIYKFQFGMQGPAFVMTRRGILIDQAERLRLLEALIEQRDRLEHILNTLATAVWGRPLNANSSQSLAAFFYGTLKLPEQHRYDKQRKLRVVTTNAEAIEKLSTYFVAKPICNTIIELRHIIKDIAMLRTAIDADGRLRCSYNTTGTETGRWSSNKNVFGTGTNLQNVKDRLRRMCRADDGKKLGQADLSQAESRVVAYLSDDANYILACESGDLHTTCCRMIWPDLPWTGDLKKDKEIAEQPFYHHMSYRDMSKRVGHGSNYYGTPNAIAQIIKVPPKLISSFQELYFDRFPGIRKWQRDTITYVQQHRQIISPLGRRRQFFGRPDDPATWREAIANVPQGMIGDIVNVALYRAAKLDPGFVQVLGQVHDSILFQFPKELEDAACKAILQCLQVPFTVHGKLRLIPAEVVTGWNWSADKEKRKDNPYGLKDWRAGTPDLRTPPTYERYAPQDLPFMDRVLRHFH